MRASSSFARRELSAREHPAQGGACRGQPTFQQPLIDELLLRLGILLQQDFEDVLSTGLDLGVVDRSEPPQQFLTRRHRHR